MNKELTLKDFYDPSDLDLMERANEFKKMLEDLNKKKHFQYKRISINHSYPIRKVIDTYDGVRKDMIYLASNDYLNLTNHPKVKKAGINAINKYGAGAGSVPLLGGTTDLHVQLENEIAKFKGCEKAIIYSSGYGSNSSSLLCMLSKKDVAIIDVLAHASLIDGCKNTNVIYFKHNDIHSLEMALIKARNNKFRTKLIVVDGVYSMDGDIACLDKISLLSKEYNSYVMVDEAHATGVLGDQGRGTPEYFNLIGKIDIVCGTFSKALGGVGGFVASNKNLIDLLHFYSRGYMFSTAMAPSSVGSILEAIKIIQEEPERRKRLWNNITYFKSELIRLGFDIGKSQTAIFPILIKNDFLTKEICRELHELNIYVNPVFYPAVPSRLSRIRISIMSEHTKKQLGTTLNILEYVGKKYKLI